ncbi:glycosyltransferase family 9 protein [Aeromicrobium sp. 179-A 4D2 NHS]|uniref:glycosyltransferase family 9 protein n=1 Tax=Aeromicrobium sp. 179-A 4D2 NHS TaxID=3142375 RepID=UPI00399F3970
MPADVLVLRALGLGDTLAAVPALRALRRAGLGRITLAGPAGPGGLLRRHGLVDEVVPAAGLGPLRVPPARVAVNLHGRGPQSHRLLLAGGHDEVVAFACAEAGVEGPPWRQDEGERARWCRLVTSRWDVDAAPDDVLLADDHPRDGQVVVHPGAASGARRWPVERWAEVVRALDPPGVRITGGEDERDLALRLADLAGLPESSVLAGRTSLDDLADCVARAGLVLSGDTGIAHVAYAFGTPSVTLFGPTPPRWWGPPATGPHVALWHGDGAGDPHADAPDPALLRIGTDEVVAAARAAQS